MAIIKCPECAGSVSDKAAACIHCGYPLAGNKKDHMQYMAESILSDSSWRNHEGWFSFHDGRISGQTTRIGKTTRFSGTAEYDPDLKCIVLHGPGIEDDQISIINRKNLNTFTSFSLAEDFYPYDEYNEEDNW